MLCRPMRAWSRMQVIGFRMKDGGKGSYKYWSQRSGKIASALAFCTVFSHTSSIRTHSDTPPCFQHPPPHHYQRPRLPNKPDTKLLSSKFHQDPRCQYAMLRAHRTLSPRAPCTRRSGCCRRVAKIRAEKWQQSGIVFLLNGLHHLGKL